MFRNDSKWHFSLPRRSNSNECDEFSSGGGRWCGAGEEGSSVTPSADSPSNAGVVRSSALGIQDCKIKINFNFEFDFGLALPFFWRWRWVGLGFGFGALGVGGVVWVWGLGIPFRQRTE